MKITMKDFVPSLGDWTGNLTYLDYTSGKPYTLPVKINISQNKGSLEELIWVYTYPNEPRANSIDTVKITRNGAGIDNERVVEVLRSVQANFITTERNGVDGNDHKPAVIRHVYAFGNENLEIKKLVKFDGEDKWILRNDYVLKR